MFRGLSFDVCGDLYASQFEVRSQIRNAGGNVIDIKNEWSSSLPTYMLSSKRAVATGTNDKVVRAQQLNVPILESTYIRDCLAANGLLPVSKYQLWVAPNGEQPFRPRPPNQPPPQPVKKSEPPKPTPTPTPAPAPAAATKAPSAAPVQKPVPAAPAASAATTATPAPQPKESSAPAAASDSAAANAPAAASTPAPEASISRRKSKDESTNGIKRTSSKKDMVPFDISSCTFHVSQSLQTTAAFGQREQVLQAIAAKKCTMITGPPGCGKTSVIPQLVLDAGIIATGRQVVCVQPHQASAISAGEFVAHKRYGQVGSEVGYQVRFVNRTGPNTRLVYATTDLLLRRLQIEPTLATVGCIIFDDIHIRDLHTEALLGIIRELLRKKGTSLKLVLIGGLKDHGNAEERLTEYFKPSTLRVVHLQCPLPNITEHYLEEALSWTTPAIANGIPKNCTNPLEMWKEGQMHTLIQDLVLQYHLKEPSGAVLVFLPEWNDVAVLHTILAEASQDIQLLALHSLVSSETLQQAFAPAPAGKRKVILTTDFAESCASFKDVRYVIDSGVSKSEIYDETTGHYCLHMSLVTRESALRRCQACPEGKVVHLFMSTQKDQLPSARFPARNLEDLVLQRRVSGASSIQVIADGFLTVPSITALANADKALQNMHALSATGELTTMGRLVSRIPVPPIVAKLLLWGAALRVLKPCAVVAAFLSTHSPFIMEADDSKLDFDPDCQSDHLALVQAYARWQEADKKNDISFCTRHRLSTEILEMTQVLVTQFVSLMMDAGYDGPDCQRGKIQSYADLTKPLQPTDVALLKCCITAAFHPNTFSIQRAADSEEGAKFLSSTGEEAFPNSSFLHVAANKQQEHHWVVHSRAMHVEDRLQFMDSTLVNNNYIVLFCGRLAVCEGAVQLDGWQADVANADSWDSVLQFRARVGSAFQECTAQRNFSLFPDELVDEVLGYVTENLIELSNVHPANQDAPLGDDWRQSAPYWATTTSGQ